MRYFLVNQALEVVEVSDKFPAVFKEPGGRPDMWARQQDGSYGAGWLNRNDISQHPAPMMFAQQIADSASALLGRACIATDAGDCVSPRYDVIEAPMVGDEVSMGFNGDYYPVGKIVAIQKNYRRIRVEGPRGPLIFSRRKESGSWANRGMWSLVPGVRNEWNQEF